MQVVLGERRVKCVREWMEEIIMFSMVAGTVGGNERNVSGSG